LPDRADDALREVRERLDEAHAAADRLVQEGRRRAEDATGEDAPRVPPRGWDAGHGDAAAGSEFQALLALLDSARDAVPAELSHQVSTALRDLLLALRALIEWYLERLGEPAPGRPGPEVEDIPLD